MVSTTGDLAVGGDGNLDAATHAPAAACCFNRDTQLWQVYLAQLWHVSLPHLVALNVICQVVDAAYGHGREAVPRAVDEGQPAWGDVREVQGRSDKHVMVANGAHRRSRKRREGDKELI